MIIQLKENIWQLHFEEFGSCVYIIKLNNKTIMIDTSSSQNKEELLFDFKSLSIRLEDINTIILTHTHWDHIGNTNLFPKAKLYTQVNINQLKIPEFKIISTPGHTPDSICILYKDILFSGDTIFDKNHNYVGRTDLPESNPEEMQESLEKLKEIKYEILAPGHLV